MFPYAPRWSRRKVSETMTTTLGRVDILCLLHEVELRRLLVQEGRRATAGQVLIAFQLALAGKSPVRPPIQPVSGLQVVGFPDEIVYEPRRIREAAEHHLPATEKVEVAATLTTKHARKNRRRQGWLPGSRVAYGARGCHTRNSYQFAANMSRVGQKLARIAWTRAPHTNLRSVVHALAAAVDLGLRGVGGPDRGVAKGWSSSPQHSGCKVA